MAQRITANARVGKPAAKPPPKPPKAAPFKPPGVRGPVGVKPPSLPRPSKPPPGPRGPVGVKAPKKAPIDEFFQAVQGGKGPGGASGSLGVRAPKLPPTPTPHGKLPMGTVPNNKHLARLSEAPSSVGALDHIASGIVSGVLAGNPILSLEANVARHVTNPRAALRAQANATVGPDITSAATGGKFSKVGLGLGIAGLWPGDGGRLLEAGAEGLVKADRGIDAGLAAERAAVRKSLASGKNKSRVIFEKGSAEVFKGRGVEAVGPRSRSGVLPGLQHIVDTRTQRVIDRSITGDPTTFLSRHNVGNLVKTRQHFTDQVQRAAAEALARSDLPKEQQLALKMVATETGPEQWLKHITQAIKEAKSPREVKQLEAERALVPDAGKYVRMVRTEHAGEMFPTRLAPGEATVVLHGSAPRQMQYTWAQMLHVAKQRSEQLRQAGLLDPATEAERLSAPGRVMRGARWEGPQSTGGLIGAEEFKGGRVYFPSRREGRAVRGIGRFKPGAIIGNKPNKAVGLVGRYHGDLPLMGEESINTPRDVGQSGASAQRYTSALRGLGDLQKRALTGPNIPEDLKHYQAIWLGNATDREKADLNQALQALHEGKKLSARGLNAVKKMFGGHLDHIFPSQAMNEYLRGDANYGFVHESRIGERANYNPVTEGERVFAGLSNTLKKAIVYTKMPGHVVSRRLSNGFFNLAQMGPKLLPIAVKQIAFNHRYPELGHIMDSLTGEGSLGAIADTPTERALVRPVRRMADQNPRRMAVYYELERAAGHSLTVDEAAQYLKELHNAPPGSALHQKLVDISQRATVHSGDYARMSAAEKRVVQRVFFLWPWHRAAAVTTAKWALEHPLSAAATGAGLYYLNEKVNKGAQPWNRFNVPVPGGRAINLTTALPVSQPDQDIRTLYETGKQIAQGGQPSFGEQLIGQVNPLMVLLGEAMAGRNFETGSALPRGGAFLNVAKQMPPERLAFGNGPFLDRLLKYTVGNQAPLTAPGGSAPTSMIVGPARGGKGGAVLSGGTLTGGSLSPGSLSGGSLSTKPGSITKAQHARIMHHLAGGKAKHKR